MQWLEYANKHIIIESSCLIVHLYSQLLYRSSYLLIVAFINFLLFSYFLFFEYSHFCTFFFSYLYIIYYSRILSSYFSIPYILFPHFSILYFLFSYFYFRISISVFLFPYLGALVTFLSYRSRWSWIRIPWKSRFEIYLCRVQDNGA